MPGTCEFSRLIQLRSASSACLPEANHGTLLIGRESPRPISARNLFVHRYLDIHAALEACDRPGVLLLAFDRQEQPIGTAWLAATSERARALIVGRHSRCGLVIPPHHATIALRHLAVIVRLGGHGVPLTRVIDLCTHTGFVDEAGRVLQSASVDGPAFLATEEVQLVVLPTGDGRVWPADAEAAYASLPPRSFRDERVKTWGVAQHPRAFEDDVSAEDITSVSAILPPLQPGGRMVEDGESVVGRLFIGHSGHSVQRSVGRRALERGILLGRYARCDLGSDFRSQGRISRVHLLLIHDGGGVVAIDTASTNGTLLGGDRIDLLPLADGTSLNVAKVLNVVWHEVPASDTVPGSADGEEALSHSVLLEVQELQGQG